MSYTKNIYTLGNAIEVEEKHTYRLRSPGMKREKKKKLTPAQMKAVNQKNKEKKCTVYSKCQQSLYNSNDRY